MKTTQIRVRKAIEKLIPELNPTDTDKRRGQIFDVVMEWAGWGANYSVDIFSKNDRQVTVTLWKDAPPLTFRMIWSNGRWFSAFPKTFERKVFTDFIAWAPNEPKKEVLGPCKVLSFQKPS